jgi:hypothetical protein
LTRYLALGLYDAPEVRRRTTRTAWSIAFPTPGAGEGHQAGVAGGLRCSRTIALASDPDHVTITPAPRFFIAVDLRVS